MGAGASRGFSRDIRSMRLTSSGATAGRPTGCDFHAQKRAKPRRCHGTNARSIGTQPRPRGGATQNGKLLAQKKVFGDKACPRSQHCEQCAGDNRKNREHPGDARSVRRPCHPRIAPSRDSFTAVGRPRGKATWAWSSGGGPPQSSIRSTTPSGRVDSSGSRHWA
jgi:hypothetical protein